LQQRSGFYRNDDAAYLNAVLRNTALQYFANVARTMGKIHSGRGHEIKKMGAVTTVGFKDFITNFQRYGLTDYLEQERDAKIIGLTRRNVLERMVSNAFLQATGVIASTSREVSTAPKTLLLNPDTVLHELEVIDRENRDLAATLESFSPERVFRLDYADLYAGEANTVEVVRQIYAFLEVPDMVPKVRMRKIVKSNPLDALENGEEIREVVERSKFAVYLPGGPDN
jgi:hypothetical protein